MKEYEIIKETVTPGYFLDEKQEDGSVERKFIQTGDKKDKWNICYYKDGILVNKEFYSYDGINPTDDYKVLNGYSPKDGSIIGEKELISVDRIDITSIVEEIQKNYILTERPK